MELNAARVQYTSVDDRSEYGVRRRDRNVHYTADWGPQKSQPDRTAISRRGVWDCRDTDPRKFKDPHTVFVAFARTDCKNLAIYFALHVSFAIMGILLQIPTCAVEFYAKKCLGLTTGGFTGANPVMAH